jgi:peptide/nickel transport system substrate-binding protein
MNRRCERWQAPSLGTLGAIVALLLMIAPPAWAHHGASVLAKPHIGGTITVRDPETPDCLDPQRTVLGASDAIFEEVVDTLVTQDEHGRLRPSLALRWKFSKGGKVITFWLRHGVHFSNGDPLTATDVKFSFERALNPATKSPGTFGFLGPMQSVQVVNKYEVRLIMKAPYRPLMTNLAIGYEGILDPKAVAQEGNTKFCQYPVGSGPFKVQSVAPGFSTVTLVRNPLHNWEPPWMHNQGPAYLSSVIWKPITSDATAISELLAGQLDITNVPGPQLSRVEHNPTIVLHKHYLQGENYLGFNMSHPPFDKLAVRRAVAEAIDRKALIKVALNGLGKPAYSPIPSTIPPYYDKNAPKYALQYNPSDAQQIIASNHASGPYTLLIYNDPTQVTAAEFIQAQLASVGMKVNIVSKPIADYVGVAQKGQFDLNLLGWGWNDPDLLYQLFHSSQGKGNGINFTFYTSPTLDKLIIEGRETVNQKKAVKVYAQLQRFMDKNVIIDPLWIDENIFATRSRVKGWHTNISAFEPLFQDLYVTK